MIILGLLIGIYAYGIFFLGIGSLLYMEVLFWFTLCFWIFVCISYRQHVRLRLKKIKIDRTSVIISLFICLSFGIHLIGAFGPELAFDSLWYHLTLPKMFLLEHAIVYIPGGLFYYSTMPKLTELLYTPALAFSGEIAAKLIHYTFGVLGVYLLYKLSRQFLSVRLSLLVVSILVSNLVFAWEMTTSFNDLTWLFYELLAFTSFLTFLRNKQQMYLLCTGVFVGFAIMTKMVALLSLGVYGLLLLFYFWPRIGYVFRQFLLLVSIALLIPLPWFIFSYMHTGNAFYPFFSGYLSSYEQMLTFHVLDPVSFLKKIGELFFLSSDPISPVYVIFFPLLFFIWRYVHGLERVVFYYCLFSLVFWYISPDSGGARFILPYLPVFSLAVGLIISKMIEHRHIKFFEYLSIGVVLVALSISTVYRGVANMKYVPFLIGHESKSAFLSKHLNFQFADFYDTDGYFAENIFSRDTVLLFGFHNLFYVDFPFVHESYYNGQNITHIATQRADIPHEYRDWKLIYSNDKTQVKLYEHPKHYVLYE